MFLFASIALNLPNATWERVEDWSGIKKTASDKSIWLKFLKGTDTRAHVYTPVYTQKGWKRRLGKRDYVTVKNGEIQVRLMVSVGLEMKRDLRRTEMNDKGWWNLDYIRGWNFWCCDRVGFLEALLCVREIRSEGVRKFILNARNVCCQNILHLCYCLYLYYNTYKLRVPYFW